MGVVHGRSGSLSGYCAIASDALNDVLKSYGFDSKIVHADLKWYGPHCWIELNGWAIDITATQFAKYYGEYPKVLVVRPQDHELYQSCMYFEPESFWITEEELEDISGWKEEVLEKLCRKSDTN